MNCEVITVPPVPVKPTKTYVLTLSETEASALKSLVGMQSRNSIDETARKSASSNHFKDAQLETIRVVNDKIYDALYRAHVDDLA